MTDPRIIALSSNPGQVEPGPFSEHELRQQWNAQADEFNQWESLDSSEQLAWAQARAIAADRNGRPAAQPAAQPVDVPNLMRLTEGVDPIAPGDPDVDHILALAQILEEVDGRYDTYPEDAKAILAHPGFSGCHDGPVAPTVSTAEPSPVAISEAQNIGVDELYTDWYRCPQCKDDMIPRGSNFCPKCGVKLQWEGGVTHA